MSTQLVTTFTEAEARELTAELKADYGSLQMKIATAWRGRIWTVLGYESWQDYLDQEFVDVSLRPPKGIEDQVIAELRAAGMSTRGIAAAVDISQPTVRRRLVASGESNDSPSEEAGITGTDGKRYPAKSAGDHSDEPGIVDAEVIEDPDTDEGPVTGGDRLVDDLGIAPADVDMTGRPGLSRDQVNRLIAELHTSGSAPLPAAKKRCKTLELAFSSGHVDTGELDTEKLDDLAVEAADTMSVLSDLLAVMAGHAAGQVTAAMDNPDTIGSVEKTVTNLNAVTRSDAGRAGA